MIIYYGKPSDLLLKAADEYEAQGVHRGSLRDPDSGRCCALGIIAKVATGNPENGYALRAGRAGLSAQVAVRTLADEVLCGRSITRFNDDARTGDGRLLNVKSITAKFRKAARRLQRQGR